MGFDGFSDTIMKVLKLVARTDMEMLDVKLRDMEEKCRAFLVKLIQQSLAEASSEMSKSNSHCLALREFLRMEILRIESIKKIKNVVLTLYHGKDGLLDWLCIADRNLKPKDLGE